MSKITDLKKQALAYHAEPRAGKLSVESSKPCENQHDLSLAYTPGVAEPVKAIAEDPAAADLYTNKRNLVAVVSDGTAVLGLGNVGPLASKPVMEGKAILFKRFADIDVFDLEIDAPSNEAFIETVANLEPTFGGINLEDIAAPHCFQIEEALRERMDIPVFHDDQHGTAIVVGAALKNALEIQGQDLGSVNIVVIGAGAAGIAIAKLLRNMGATFSNMKLVDSKGVIHSGRDDLNLYKQTYAVETEARSLEDAMIGADVVIGVSGPDTITADMVKSMSKRAVVFALSNPDPEIHPDVAKAANPDAIVATGRSDFPNQVNNALCFPYLFRGVLDAGIKSIDTPILLAVVDALANTARLPVEPHVLEAYGLEGLEFGPDYILPKQFDSRLRQNIVDAIFKVHAEQD